MNRVLPLVLLVPALLAGACAPVETAAPPTVLPATEASRPASPGSVVASAVIAPALDSDLSFVVAGTVRELQVREGEPVQAGQTLMTLNTPDLEYAVTQAEAAVRSAEFEYQYWIPARLDRPPERRQLAEQELVKVQKSLEVARAELTRAILTAPFDGTVVDVRTAPGELVQPGQIVVTLAGLDHLLIETTDLSERDLPAVEPGQKASVFVEAVGQEFPATVTAIAPLADTVGGDVVYKVTLEFDTQPGNLLWGMSAEVSISTE